MAKYFRPVEKVGNVVIVGERHRERGSGRLVKEVLKNHDIEGVCVEVGPQSGYRGNGGGAVGESLVWAEKRDVPRLYVDEPKEEVIEALGGKLRAYAYLKKLESEVPSHEQGLIGEGLIQEVRDDVQTKFGNESFDKLFTNREEKMAGRAEWATDYVEGDVLLVVGAAHFQSIVNLLEEGVEKIEIQETRHRTGERVAAGAGPWTTVCIFTWRGLRNIETPSLSEISEHVSDYLP